jgi:hypothetical protein
MATTIDTNPPLFNGTGDDDSEHWAEIAAVFLDPEMGGIFFVDVEVLEELRK